MRRRVLWLLPCALATCGCSLIARATIMPTIDSHGVVSVEAKLTGALGLTTSFDHEKATDSTIGLIAIPASAVGAVRASRGSTGELGFETGLEYARVGRDTGKVGFRAGSLFSERVDLGVSAPPQFGTTLSTALLFVVSTSAPRTGSLTDGGRARLAVGPAVDATVLSRRDHDREQIGAGLSVDLYDLTQWTVR
jgi:hypothetical protein